MSSGGSDSPVALTMLRKFGRAILVTSEDAKRRSARARRRRPIKRIKSEAIVSIPYRIAVIKISPTGPDPCVPDSCTALRFWPLGPLGGHCVRRVRA